jgi:hypothetical protein
MRAALLVVAREGAAAGPKSLGKAARFVVDHATCPVLLIWPGPVPEGPPPGSAKPPRGEHPPHAKHPQRGPGDPPGGPGRPQPFG